MYMKPPEPEAYAVPYPQPFPQPFHPENIIQGPIRVRQKGPSPPYLAAQEVPKRVQGKQEEPLWMSLKDARIEHNRAVTAYRRDQLGRFLGGKGSWV